jgi:uncharacterized protein (DUF1800 family)
MKSGEAKDQLRLMAHLMRRAGFTATRNELEAYVEQGYEQTVEKLLHPQISNHMPDDIIRRYHVGQHELRQLDEAGAYWMYRMITSENPLEEKMALFWHGLFATGYSKLNQARVLLNQVDMFRNYGLGSFRTLLIELSKDPAMIIWLDNNENHNGAINENYGRELLELFSMGIGNYTEQDIKECARAFTGWTVKNAEYMAMRASKDSIWPYGRIAWHYEYRSDDHDTGDKEFLNQKGDFNGEEVIDIIVRQEATARFLSTRLFLFFVADDIDKQGENLIKTMMDEYFQSNFNILSVMRILLNSDYFKSDTAFYARVKAPIESVVGTARLAGSYREPTLDVHSLWSQATFMGQGLLSPPTVEGWHEGTEWIDSGALVERINFVSNELSNSENPGIKFLINTLLERIEGPLTAEKAVDGCLDLIGPIEVNPDTYAGLMEFTSKFMSQKSANDKNQGLVANLLGMIGATREYQLA